ncbi:hypothetical protein ACFQYP_28695 [Nonomuraea antimicrobica]
METSGRAETTGPADATGQPRSPYPAETGQETGTETSPATPPDGDGAPDETPDSDLEIPAAFEGDWSGPTTSTNPLDTDGAENRVELEEGESTAQWEEKDQDDDCRGTITLTKVEPTRLTFSLGQNDGNCIPGTITLDRQGDGLTYTWRDVPGPGLVTQTGTLKKN